MATILQTFSNAFFFNEKFCIWNYFSLKFVPKGLINNIPALVKIMACSQSGDKPLSEPKWLSLLTHICVCGHQWVKGWYSGQLMMKHHKINRLLALKRLNSLQWHHNESDGISNHQHLDCLLNHLFGCRSKKTSELCVTGLCEGNSPVTSEFLAQRASYMENVSI